MPPTTENVTVRMRPEVAQKLAKIAARLSCSRNWLINQAIAHYVNLHDWQTARIRERWQETERGGALVPHDHVMARIAGTITARAQ